jgi:predicted ATPase
MGKRNYLIEGVSGGGKTAVCTELQRRGYQAIHGDRELVCRPGHHEPAD